MLVTENPFCEAISSTYRSTIYGVKLNYVSAKTISDSPKSSSQSSGSEHKSAPITAQIIVISTS